MGGRIGSIGYWVVGNGYIVYGSVNPRVFTGDVRQMTRLRFKFSIFNLQFSLVPVLKPGYRTGCVNRRVRREKIKPRRATMVCTKATMQ
jgi:hypothetical protein